MAVIAVIMSVNFAACSDDDEEGSTPTTENIVGQWVLTYEEGYEIDTWDYTNDPYNPDYDSEKIVIKKLSDNTYSITSYYYSGSDWQMDGSQTGTLDGKTIVLKEHDGWFEYANPVIETLTTDKLVLRIKYDNVQTDPDYDPEHRHSGDFTETYTKMK